MSIEVEKLLGQFKWKEPVRSAGVKNTMPVLKIIYHPTGSNKVKKIGRYELSWNGIAADEMGFKKPTEQISVSHEGDVVIATNVPPTVPTYVVRMKSKKAKNGYLIVNRDLITSIIERLGLSKADLKGGSEAIHVQLFYKMTGEADKTKVFTVTKKFK